MVSWSGMLRYSEPKIKLFSTLLSRNKNVITNGQIRKSSHTFEIRPSSWHWQKTKDFFHFYVMVGAIPLTIITIWANIFIGPATLEPIPEGYVPKHWEYYRSPITRFISRYMMPTPQQEYEKQMYGIWREATNVTIRKIYQRVEDLVRERDDYQHYYYIPDTAKSVHQGRYRNEFQRVGVSKYGSNFVKDSYDPDGPIR